MCLNCARITAVFIYLFSLYYHTAFFTVKFHGNNFSLFFLYYTCRLILLFTKCSIISFFYIFTAISDSLKIFFVVCCCFFFFSFFLNKCYHIKSYLMLMCLYNVQCIKYKIEFDSYKMIK